jgi:hypothetical protein
MEDTFADESFATRSWAEHVVLAHINFSQNLDWFFQLMFNLRQQYPGEAEFKADSAIKLLDRLDIHLKAKIWRTLQDTIIIVQDPQEYLKGSGVSILRDESLRFEYKGHSFVVDKSHKDYPQINENLQRRLTEIIIDSSPIYRIGFSLNELPLHPHIGNYFTPENILGLIGKKDSRKDVINTIKLSARLCSAFYELIDPEAKRRIIEQFVEYELDYLVVMPSFHKQLLKQAVTHNRFFDEGHTPSVQLIKQCFEQIGCCLESSYEDEESQVIGSVKELDSKHSIMLQACDFAAGIARKVYKTEGLKGLKDNFKSVIFNGSII